MISRTLLFFITTVISLQSTAAVVDIVFDIESNQRLVPVADGRFVTYNGDQSYINEQFQIKFRIDSDLFSTYSDDGYVSNSSAQYDNPVVTDTSMAAQHVNTFQSPTELITSTNYKDLFVVSQTGNDPINENVIAATNTFEYLITTEGDYRYYQSYRNGLSLTLDETSRLNNQGYIQNHDDFVSLLEYLMQNETAFSFSNLVEYSEYTTYLRGVPDYTLAEGVLYQGSATISSISTVPVPAAVWLFGSGLIGLVGMARRKKYKN